MTWKLSQSVIGHHRPDRILHAQQPNQQLVQRAILALERHARRDLAPKSVASLRTIARRVLGIL